MEACSSRELVKRNVFPSSIFQLSYLMLNAKIRHFHKHPRASMPRTSLKRQHSESRYVYSKFLTSVEGTKRLSMGKRTTFSRNNSSFLDYHLNLEEKGKRLEDSVEDCARVKWCPWFVSKRILFLLLCFPASRIGCATALFQYEKKWNGFSFSLSLVERDDNSTCVNSFRSKKNKRKAKKREDRESISRVKSSEVYEGGGKKTFSALLLAIVFSPRRNLTLVKRYFRIESNRSWGTNVAKLVGCLKRSRPVEIEVGELVTFLPTNAKFDRSNKCRVAWLRFYQFSRLTIFLAKYYYYGRNIITQSLNYHEE